MIFDIGPFRLRRVSKSGTLEISLRCMEKLAFGWEYGWRDAMRNCSETPIIQFRIGKLMILYIEFYKNSCEILFMGFWAFPSWEKERNDANI